MRSQGTQKEPRESGPLVARGSRAHVPRERRAQDPREPREPWAAITSQGTQEETREPRALAARGSRTQGNPRSHEKP